MTSTGHWVMGLGVALPLAAAGHTDLALGVIAGAKAPDWLEGSFFVFGTNFRLIPHRTLTHWPPLYLALAAWLLWGGGAGPYTLIALGFILGCVIHLACDVLTPTGLPLLHPFGKRYGWGLFRTGSFAEWLVIATVVSVESLFLLG